MHPSAPASRSQGYPRLQILFHWLSVLLMASLALAGGLRDLLVSHTAIDMRSVMVVHIGCGMALLSLTLLRAATRLAGPALPPLAGSSRAQRVAPTPLIWRSTASSWVHAYWAGSSSTPRA